MSHMCARLGVPSVLASLSAAALLSVTPGCSGQFELFNELVGGSGASDGRAVIVTDPNDYCAVDSSWDGAWVEFEVEVLQLVNQHRRQGAECGYEGRFGPTDPLRLDDKLRCAARNHALDMAIRNFFGHVNPDGLRAGDRIELAGYSWSSWGENIASGQTSPQRVVQSWMDSPSHCANVMDPDFTETGVGYYAGNYWALTFGQPID